MKISIGSDHRGYKLKEFIKKQFPKHTWIDVGTVDADNRVDYPRFAQKVCRSMIKGEAERGIVLCGSGVGVSIAANRYPKIYAALCWSPQVAVAAREHDDANVLALPADFISEAEAIQIVMAWLETPFKGGRYAERLAQVDTP